MTIEELTALVATMRQLGIRTYKADGVELDLADAPPPERVPAPAPSPADLVAARNAAKERHLRTMFAASSQIPRLQPRPNSDG